MKVGLCCCYSNHNYGSMLQSLATLAAIQSLGHECSIIRYKKHYSTLQKIRYIPRVFNGGNIANVKKRKASRKIESLHPDIVTARSLRDRCFDDYCDRTFGRYVEEKEGYAALCECSKEYDAVVVGSDQMWLPLGLPTNFYNLQFVDAKTRRVSYATSFGVSSIPWYQKGRTADFLKKIDYLSVREDSGAKICKEVGGVTAKVVVDPTLLLSRERWLELAPLCLPEREPYIFCYFLGANPLCREEANAISAKTGLPLVTLRHANEIIPSDESFGDEAPYDVDPAGFVNLIRGAEYVLTDSFHATVFSIINKKQFATYFRFAESDKQSRNSRITSLLDHLQLQNRLIVEPGKTQGVLENPVRYDLVDGLLADWRSDSWDFLKLALS